MKFSKLFLHSTSAFGLISFGVFIAVLIEYGFCFDVALGFILSLTITALSKLAYKQV